MPSATSAPASPRRPARQQHRDRQRRHEQPGVQPGQQGEQRRAAEGPALERAFAHGERAQDRSGEDGAGHGGRRDRRRVAQRRHGEPGQQRRPAGPRFGHDAPGQRRGEHVSECGDGGHRELRQDAADGDRRREQQREPDALRAAREAVSAEQVLGGGEHPGVVAAVDAQGDRVGGEQHRPERERAQRLGPRRARRDGGRLAVGRHAGHESSEGVPGRTHSPGA